MSISDLEKRQESLQKENKILNEELNQQFELVASLKCNEEESESVIKELKDTNAKNTTTIETLRSNIEKTEIEIQNLILQKESINNNLQATIDDLRSQLDKSTSTNSELISSDSKSKDVIVSLKTQLESMENSLKEKNIELKNIITNHETQLNSQKEIIESQKGEIDTIQRDFALLKNNSADSEKSLLREQKYLEEQLGSYKSEVEILISDKVNLQNELDSKMELISTLEARESDSNLQITSKIDEIQSLESSLAGSMEEIETREVKISKLESQITELKENSQNQSDKLKSIQEDFKTKEESMSEEIENLKSELSGSIVEYKTRVQKDENEIEQLKTTVDTKEHIIDGLKADVDHKTTKINELEINVDESNKQISNLNTETSELNERLEKQKAHLNDVTTRHEEHVRQLKEITEKQEKHSDEREVYWNDFVLKRKESFSLKFGTIENQLQVVKESLADNENQVSTLLSEKHDIQSEMDALQSRYEDSQAMFNALQAKHKTLEQQTKKQKRRFESKSMETHSYLEANRTLRAETEELQNVRTTLLKKIEVLEMDVEMLNGAQAESERLAKQSDELKTEVTRLKKLVPKNSNPTCKQDDDDDEEEEEENIKNNEQIQQLTDQISTITAERDNLLSHFDAVQQKHKKFTQKVTQQNEEISKLTNQTKSLNDETQAKNDELIELKKQLSDQETKEIKSQKIISQLEDLLANMRSEQKENKDHIGDVVTKLKAEKIELESKLQASESALQQSASSKPNDNNNNNSNLMLKSRFNELKVQLDKWEGRHKDVTELLRQRDQVLKKANDDLLMLHADMEVLRQQRQPESLAKLNEMKQKEVSQRQSLREVKQKRTTTREQYVRSKTRIETLQHALKEMQQAMNTADTDSIAGSLGSVSLGTSNSLSHSSTISSNQPPNKALEAECQGLKEMVNHLRRALESEKTKSGSLRSEGERLRKGVNSQVAELDLMQGKEKSLYKSLMQANKRIDELEEENTKFKLSINPKNDDRMKAVQTQMKSFQRHDNRSVPPRVRQSRRFSSTTSVPGHMLEEIPLKNLDTGEVLTMKDTEQVTPGKRRMTRTGSFVLPASQMNYFASRLDN
eukprot:TRINITY_DN177_c0_g1_i3.p1 TRINITY_DN177_c0_g1~~TRINITY_DN177_c0_g1_i3.p1  ORF type:complete len:1109 (-),score=377.04 TRINITY_DN177_c0_g1_i3:486-3761(-)